MQELTDYDIRHINESIEKIETIFSNTNKKIEQSNRYSDYKELRNRLNSYVKEAEVAQKSLEKSIKTVIDGNKGFFNNKDGINDLINKQLSILNNNLNDLSKNFSKSAKAIIRSINNASKPDLITITTDFDNILSNEKELNIFDDKNESLKSNEIIEKDNVEYEDTNLSSQTDSTLGDASQNSLTSSTNESNDLISDINSILDMPLEKEKSKKQKRIVIRKNTPLDNDEIKNLFISRKSRYCLNLEQLNYGIEYAGNNVDKDKILLGAMYKKFTDDLNNGDYFYLINDSRLIREFLINEPKKALEFLFGDFLLFCSGYANAHALAPWRAEFSSTYIDPRILSSQILELNKTLNLSKEELKKSFIESKTVREIFSKLQKPFFDIETSSEIMLKAYESPNEFLNCSKLGFRRIN